MYTQACIKSTTTVAITDSNVTRLEAQGLQVGIDVLLVDGVEKVADTHLVNEPVKTIQCIKGVAT